MAWPNFLGSQLFRVASFFFSFCLAGIFFFISRWPVWTVASARLFFLERRIFRLHCLLHNAFGHSSPRRCLQPFILHSVEWDIINHFQSDFVFMVLTFLCAFHYPQIFLFPFFSAAFKQFHKILIIIMKDRMRKLFVDSLCYTEFERWGEKKKWWAP